MMFRKFILGQANKQMLTIIPFRDCALNSKRLFDDTYLHFMDQQNHFQRTVPEVAMGIYELMHHSDIGEVPLPAEPEMDNDKIDVASYLNS